MTKLDNGNTHPTYTAFLGLLSSRPIQNEVLENPRGHFDLFIYKNSKVPLQQNSIY